MTELVWPDSVPILIAPDGDVVLRPHRSSDLERLVEQCTDPEFVRWTTVPTPYTTAHGVSFLTGFIPAEVNSGSAMCWAIEAPLDEEPVYCGSIEIRFRGDGRGEIAFGLHPDARGRGIVTTAGRLAVDWAFDVATLEMIDWHAIVGNWPSRWAAAALGFHFEGRRRRMEAQRGVLVDCWVGSLLPTDPRTSVAAPRQPELTGSGLRLRPLADGDGPRLVEIANDPLSRWWLPNLPAPYGSGEARDFIEAWRENQALGRAWAWAVTETGSDELLGVVSLRGLDQPDRDGEIGYSAHPEVRGRGVLKAAVRLVADFSVAPDGPLHTVRFRVAPGNVPSLAVAAAAGGVRVGVHPEAGRTGDGAWTDLVLFVRRAESGVPGPGVR